ncbi:DUF3298 and DUF4163 domain-containing protein [Fulvivirga maritima]|uniref:DUF3298 and DUF4163 domain-containing protein n=1 Tax=Fulvivirga maritima TaxID=2904247 RepID=UPI001F305A26|nr:DUF3298 and DUF4163 domain-containing protein [Fulvivirga maritima]UII27466.1 DUF3298 and DUF4163 domain-containing protein [Fulvivirga maritima]
MKIMKAQWLLIALVLLVTSCSKTEKQDTAEEQPAESKIDSLSYTFNDYTKEYGKCDTDTSAYCTRILLNYPEFDTEEHPSQATAINEQIESYVLNQFFPDTVENKSIAMFVEGFIEDYKEVKEAFGEAFGWYAKINGKVLRNDSISVTIELTADIYTGGAHGSFDLHYLNFNPSTGDLIDFESLFEPNYSTKLNEIVEQKFRETYKIEPGTDLGDEGYEFEDGLYYNINNFALLEDGIKFYYNSYEIAPYAKGPSEVFVSYADLKEILKKAKEDIVV